MGDITFLHRQFLDKVRESVGDIFAGAVYLSESINVGFGDNGIRPYFNPFVHPRAQIIVGCCGADLNNPNDLFEIVQSFFHELQHVKHHAEAYRGNGFNEDMSQLTIEYLAAANDPVRYKDMYGSTLFETDANKESLEPTIEFCSNLIPGVDFNQIAVDYWKTRSKTESVPFVEDWEQCTTVDDIMDGMKKHLELCRQAKPMRPRTGVDFFGQIRTDGSLTYLQNYASKQFCELWKNAENNQERNYLSAAIYVKNNPRAAKTICPDISKHDICLYGINVSEIVRKSSELTIANTERDFWSEHDMVGDLRTQLASGQLQVNSAGSGFEDRLTLG